MTYKIAVIPGDGIGPEVMDETVKVFDCVAKKFGLDFHYTYLKAGGCAYDEYGDPLPDVTLETALKCDAVMLGAVGGPKWDELPVDKRPEKALLGLRKSLGLFANLRPAVLFPQLADACPLKEEITKNGLDILVVRELTGGIYFGKRATEGDVAYDTMTYSVKEIERITHVAMKAAMMRSKRVCSVDKSNILDSSRLWRKTVKEVAKEYPEIQLDHMYVDNASMQLIRKPSQFDVIVTGNMFGDILSDEAAMLTGSIGMLPSASLGEGNIGMYEPVHGSAPDIAGRNIANPLATIMSAAMMLRYSFGLEDAAKAVEEAVSKTLDQGFRTADIAGRERNIVSTKEMGDAVARNI
jgi:3-isopropylmalate dehydrogenase